MTGVIKPGLCLTRNLYDRDVRLKTIYIQGGQFGPISIELDDKQGGQVLFRIRADKKYQIDRAEVLSSEELNALEQML